MVPVVILHRHRGGDRTPVEPGSGGVARVSDPLPLPAAPLRWVVPDLLVPALSLAFVGLARGPNTRILTIRLGDLSWYPVDTATAPVAGRRGIITSVVRVAGSRC